MKKTERVNISGIIFNIDEDGYRKLRNYLDAVAAKFEGREEGHEIVSDIESRIAELFQEALMSNKEVITIQDVDHIIGVMGHPDDYDSNPEDEKQVPIEEPRKGPKRMYRDPENAYLAGVCSGIAAYYNIDPVWLRIAFIGLALMFSTGIWAYILLWIAVPKANNTAQKLEMRGHDVNVGNIERSIREEFENVKANLDDLAKNVKNKHSQDSIKRVLHLFIELISFFVRFIGKFVGIILILIGVVLLVAFSVLLTTGSMILPFMSGNYNISLAQFFDMPAVDYLVGVIALAVVVLIPLLLLIFIGSKLIFNFKTRNHYIGFTSLGVWIVGIIVFSVIALNQLQTYKAEDFIKSSHEIVCKQDTIVIKTINDEINSHEDINFNLGRLAVGEINNKNVIYGRPKLNIERSETGQMEIILSKSARGQNRQHAAEYAKKINYNWTKTDSSIAFDTHFFVSGTLSWKVQDLSITLKVPVGKVIYLDESANQILYDIQNVDNYWDGNMVCKKWLMTKDGLKLLQTIEEAKQDSLKNRDENN